MAGDKGRKEYICEKIMAQLKSIQRYLLIIHKIRSSNGIHMQELRQWVEDELTAHGNEEVAVSERTLKRDIADLRDYLGIPIGSSRTRGYYFPEDEVSDEGNIETVLESFNLLNALNADTGMGRFIFPERRPYRGNGHLYPLLKAIQKRMPVSVHYKKYGEGEDFRQKVFPYALKQWRSRWYLLGIPDGKEQMRTYGLDRILDLEPLGGRFKAKDVPDIETSYKDCYGIYNDERLPVEKVIISYDKREGEYVKSQPIHHSQKKLQDLPEHERLVISLHVKITKELKLELLARGFSLQVHQPESLRREIHDIYKNGMEANARENPFEQCDGK